MECLYCGWCCKNMSPLGINPCPNLIEIDGFFFCKDYEDRPHRCKDHQFDSRFCPIGMDVLRIKSIEEMRNRIDKGYSLNEIRGIKK